jgi:hypothetical protein
MANMSNYLENKLVDFLFRGVAFSAPSTLYIALCTASPTDDSTGSTITEVSGGNYVRQSYTSNTTNWSTTNADNAATSSGTTGTTTNSVSIAWTGVTWAGTVTSVAVCDSLTGGNVLFYANLAANVTVASGDSISFGINALSVQIDS